MLQEKAVGARQPEIAYEGGQLMIEGVAAAAIVALPEVETPVYVYSSALLERRFAEFRSAVQAIDPAALVCFAVKALSNQVVLRRFANLGAGADLVTRGELERAIRAGFSPERIVFSGLGKTAGDLDRAIELGVQVNVESMSELELLGHRAQVSGRRAKVAFRLNPQLDSMRAHLGQITTGKPDSKFGIPWLVVKNALERFGAKYPMLDVVGCSVHIGSNMQVEGTDASDFGATFAFLREDVVPFLIEQGVAGPIRLDLGGGVGVDYEQEPPHREESSAVACAPNRWLATYAKLVEDNLGDLVRDGTVTLIFEPGRCLSAEAGVLLTRVLHAKSETENGDEPFSVRFLIVDAGMNDLMRPSLYGSYHHIVPVDYAPSDLANVDICGAACETTDSFMRPTRELLESYSNVLIEARQVLDERAHGLKAPHSEYGEVLPKAREAASGQAGRSEYFVKRHFPRSVGQGSVVAILNAGAYGSVMASEYNTRPLIPEVLVDDDRAILIRPRPSYDDIIDRDIEREVL